MKSDRICTVKCTIIGQEKAFAGPSLVFTTHCRFGEHSLPLDGVASNDSFGEHGSGDVDIGGGGGGGGGGAGGCTDVIVFSSTSNTFSERQPNMIYERHETNILSFKNLSCCSD